MDKDLLLRYKAKNPVKFAQKFGDRPLEEVLAQPKEPKVEVDSNIKVEFTEAKDVEVGFAKPEPKKRRKKK